MFGRYGGTSDNDGYISDVPTQQSSTAGSEISHDLIQSTKALENHFKDRYSKLKNSYDDRIKQMSETITGTTFIQHNNTIRAIIYT